MGKLFELTKKAMHDMRVYRSYNIDDWWETIKPVLDEYDVEIGESWYIDDMRLSTKNKVYSVLEDDNAGVVELYTKEWPNNDIDFLHIVTGSGGDYERDYEIHWSVITSDDPVLSAKKINVDRKIKMLERKLKKSKETIELLKNKITEEIKNISIYETQLEQKLKTKEMTNIKN